MKLHLLKSVVWFAVFFSIVSVSAQSPNKMSYQAVVRNASNALIANSNVGIQISILQTTATGTAIFVERHTTATNANGLATIEIGGGILVSGSFTTINWANGPFFIKTETDPIGGINYTISGTSQLLSVPFALFAKESGSGWSLAGNTLGTTNPFLGTIDDKDLVFRRNNEVSGRIAFINTSLGSGALANGINTTFNTAVGLRALGNTNFGGSNTAYGCDALSGNSSGSFNVALGRNTLLGNTSGVGNIAIGMSALQNGNGSNNIGIGRGATLATVSGSNQIRMGNDAVTLAAVQVAWTITSDSRWKSNIQKSDLGLNFIKQLNPVVYTRKDVELGGDKSTILETTSNPTTEYGFIAQELEATLNQFGAKNNGIITKGDDGMYGVRYNDLIAPMVKAIQEQQVIIETQKEENRLLKIQMDAMMKRLEKLETKN